MEHQNEVNQVMDSPKFDFTNGLTVREWLSGKDFYTQYNFGLDVLRNFGVIK